MRLRRLTTQQQRVDSGAGGIVVMAQLELFGAGLFVGSAAHFLLCVRSVLYGV